MARFDTSGFDDIIREVTALGNDAEAVGTRMLIAAAEEIQKAWKQAAIKHKLRDSDDMLDSIGFSRTPKDISGVKTIDIYPQGKDRRGVRNAEKAFILHYGTSQKSSGKKQRDYEKKYKGAGIPATHWVDDADEIAASLVTEVFERQWNEYLEGDKNGS